jgi:flagellar hook-length control protein FliK
MATPIKLTGNTAGNVPAVNAVNGISPAVSDMLARLGAQGQQMGFSQWMDKHAVVSGAPEQAKPASDTAQPATSSTKQPDGNAAARAAEQALARSRQQAMMANKQLEAKAAQADQSGDASKLDKRNAQSKDGANKARATDKAHEPDKADKDEDDKDNVSFNTAMGDGSAVVRELTPPATIQPNDSAGMMAWLASLTHGDLAHGKGGSASSELGDGKGLAGTSKLQGADGREQDVGLLDGKGGLATHGALALDNPLWQSVSANANLQVDAMLAQSGKVEGRGAEGDPLAGLVANGGLKGAELGRGLGEANGVRHESATLPTPVDSPDFAQALAEKVKMWVGKTADDGTMTAELHLNPAEMGPINVKISLDGQTAQVDFAAAALETRKAIEASLPMLSSALSDVGLNMTGGDVSSQLAQQFGQSFAQSQDGQGGQGGSASSGRGRGASGGDAEAGVEPIGMRAVNAPRPGRLGGLDLYA